MTAGGVAFRLVEPRADDPLYQGELALRHGVLRAPLGLAPDSVRFPFEDESLHLVALAGERVVGCVLFHPAPDGRSGRLFQMAVAPEWQGRGVGRRLVRRLEALLRERGIGRVTLHARATAVPFYERLGYEVFGEPFTEVGILHRHMGREIGARPSSPDPAP